MPIVAYVQRLARLRPTGDASVGSNLLLEYIQTEYRDQPETAEMLQQAFEMRTLIVLLDGVDEAAGLREVHPDCPLSSRDRPLQSRTRLADD